MTNFRIKGRTYRDVEKLDADGLKELRRVIVQRMTDILAEGKKLGAQRNPASARAITNLNIEMSDLHRKCNQIDGWARQKLKADVNAEVDNLMADGERAGVIEEDLTPNRTLPITTGNVPA